MHQTAAHTAITPHASAAQVLTGTSAGISLGAAAFLLVFWWVLHHKAAHRHHWLELGVEILLMAIILILVTATGFALDWIISLNHWTAVQIDHHMHGKWGTDVGALTILEGLLIGVLAFLISAQVRRRNEKGGARREPSPGYDAFEHFAYRYGFALVGPLSVTIPGGAGALIAGSLMDLSVGIVHYLSHPFGN